MSSLQQIALILTGGISISLGELCLSQDMLVRAYGFYVDAAKLPAAMTVASAFEGLRDHGVGPIDRRETMHGAASLVKHVFRGAEEDWWAGIVLRARDAKSFSKLVKANGSLSMTAEELAEGKIAESSYFLAHPTTGRGLMATYWGSPGVKLVEWALRKVFTARKTELRELALNSVTGSRAKADEAARYRGAFSIRPQIREGTLSDFLQEFKRVATGQFKIQAVEEEDRLFRTAPYRSVTRTESYTFPPDFLFNEELAHAAELELAAKDGMEATFIGINRNDEREAISNVDFKNKVVFGSTEYDELHGRFAFTHGAEGSNIADSPVIDWLKTVINHATVHQELTTPQA